MSKKYKLMLYQAAPAAGTLEVVAPFDCSVIAEVETAHAEHVERALQTAYSLYRNRDSWLPLHRRIEILEAAAQIMRDEQLAPAVL